MTLTRSSVQALRDYEYMKGLRDKWGAEKLVKFRDSWEDVNCEPPSDCAYEYLTFESDASQLVETLGRLLRHLFWYLLTRAGSGGRVRRWWEQLEGRNLQSFSSKSPPVSEYIYANAHRNRFSNAVERLAGFIFVFLYAIAGGASLIVPMVIMSIKPSLTKSLVTTSIAVTLFALVKGLVDNRNLLSLTMAYAAVLVVLVGVSPH